MSELLAVGHVARDEFPGGEWRLGGSAFYGAVTAARLGRAVTLLTRVGPGEAARVAEECARLGIELHLLPSLVTTTFAFTYWDGQRELRLVARASAIDADDVPAGLKSARAVLLGSVIGEHGGKLFGAMSGLGVLVAQGELRTIDAQGKVRFGGWRRAAEVLPHLRAVVMSEEDLEGKLAPALEWSRLAPVVVTRGAHGAALLRNAEQRRDFAAYRPKRIVDPTGAGDAFASGLAVALDEGATWEEAMDLANCVASFCLEGVGIDGLAERRSVEERLTQGERLPT